MPDNLKELINIEIPPEILSVIMAIVIAILRVIYDKKETQPTRIILEGLICGGLTMTANAAISAMGWDSQWSIVAGGTIGFMGAVWVRTQALKIINKKIG